MNMNCFAVQYDSPCHAAAARSQRLQQRVFDRLARQTVMGAYPIHVPLPQLDIALIRRTKPRRQFDQRIEHSLQVERRAADDLEDLRRGRLLLQQFGQFARRRGLLVVRLLELAGAFFELVPQFGRRRGVGAARAGRPTAFRRGGLAQPRFRRLSARSPTLLRRPHHGSATCRKCGLSVAHWSRVRLWTRPGAVEGAAGRRRQVAAVGRVLIDWLVRGTLKRLTNATVHGFGSNEFHE